MSTSPAGIYAQVIVTMQDSQNANDQNLLFGMLAFQLDFVTQKQLIETMQSVDARQDQAVGRRSLSSGN